MKLTTSALLAFSIAASSISITSQPSYAENRNNSEECSCEIIPLQIINIENVLLISFDPEAGIEAANPIASEEDMYYILLIGTYAKEELDISDGYNLWDEIRRLARTEAKGVDSDKYHLLVAKYTLLELSKTDQIPLWNEIEEKARYDAGIS